MPNGLVPAAAIGLPEDEEIAVATPMTAAEAIKQMMWLDGRGATYSPCEGFPGWYEANWFEPSMGEDWRTACNVYFGLDQALALLIQKRVKETPS